MLNKFVATSGVTPCCSKVQFSGSSPLVSLSGPSMSWCPELLPTSHSIMWRIIDKSNPRVSLWDKCKQWRFLHFYPQPTQISISRANQVPCWIWRWILITSRGVQSWAGGRAGSSSDLTYTESHALWFPVCITLCVPYDCILSCTAYCVLNNLYVYTWDQREMAFPPPCMSCTYRLDINVDFDLTLKMDPS